MVTVTTSFSEVQREEILKKIELTLTLESEITRRPQKNLLRLFESHSVACAFDNKTLVGWLVAVPLTSNCQELAMAYVIPEYRRQGVLSKLIDQLIERQRVSVIVTFHPHLAHFLQRQYNFRVATLRAVTVMTRGRFITTRLESFRSVRQVVRHLSQKKPIYLLHEGQQNGK